MRTGLSAIMLLTALSASAETAAPTIVHDRLMSRITSNQLTLPAGGITGATRLGSGQTIPLILADPLAPLKPASGLAEKSVEEKARRKVRRAAEQLKKISKDERRAGWARD